jgi:hypothetical protein
VVADDGSWSVIEALLNVSLDYSNVKKDRNRAPRRKKPPH